MRKTTTLLVSCGALLALSASGSLAATEPPSGSVTAQCTAGPSTQIAVGFHGGQRAAQTFTPAAGGHLRSVDVNTVLRDTPGSPADITVEVRTVAAGIPTATVLATATIPDADVVENSWEDYTVTFPPATAPYLSAGTPYAVVLSTPDTAANLWASQYQATCDGSQMAYYNDAWDTFTGAYDGRYAVRVGPRNDAFAAARVLPGTAAAEEGSTFGGSREPGEPAHDSIEGWDGDHSVWYRWKALGSGPVTIDTCEAEIDSILAVYTGSTLGGLTRVADNNNDPACSSEASDGWPWGSRLTFAATAGTTYRFAVGDAGGARESTFRLDLVGPANEAPTITAVRPADGATISDRTPTIAATVRDSATNLAKTDIVLRLDGQLMSGLAYDRSTDRLTFTTSRLSLGLHSVKVKATDAHGLSTTRTWSFRVR